MKKFKLIKDYPENFLKVGDIVTQDTLGQYVSENTMIFDCKVVEDFPEFWEEITETHRFYIDEPVTIWRRYWYDVKSELYVDAVDRMKEELSNNELPEDIFDESELLLDTETSNGMRELFNEQGEEIS